MEQVRARQEEAMFFALEQRSLRKRKDTPWTVRRASAVYDWAAGYGQSFIRPIWRIAQSLAVFWIIYWIGFGYVAVPSGPPIRHAGDVVVFSLQQIFRPFEIWSSRYQIADGFEALGIKTLPVFIKCFATLETLTVYGLFALFLVALRKRFRMN